MVGEMLLGEWLAFSKGGDSGGEMNNSKDQFISLMKRSQQQREAFQIAHSLFMGKDSIGRYENFGASRLLPSTVSLPLRKKSWILKGRHK
ncbi:hypothetical protein RRG08_060301 [Elysia crispata]|uniref:Uncharacterized protein n=1 Tax=Elysia crispata TaxID=231223 RepID=A0AAE0Y3V8_9GAST|nr:hypothetical protein RRG08_060301 [Elysia crispata]